MKKVRDHGAAIEHSGWGFALDDLQVLVESGYSDNGDWLRFLIIRAWPVTATPEERLTDPRYDINSGDRPLIRHPDGTMRKVGTDGHVYLFVGEELRTMRVAMNEHTDTCGLSQIGCLDGMWEYLQQFRIVDS